MAAKVQGKVIEISDQGDLVTDICGDQLVNAPRSEAVRIQVEDHETFGVFGEEHGQPAMTLIAILGNDDRLRLHLVSDSASMMLGVRKQAPVEVHWS